MPLPFFFFLKTSDHWCFSPECLLSTLWSFRLEVVMGLPWWVQWVRLWASNVGDTGSIPGLGTKIPHAPWQKKKVISALHLTNADQYVSSPKVLKLFSHSIVSNSLRELDCSMPSFPVHHQLLELAQTHVHQVGDVIQSSHPLLFPSPAFDLSQHQRLFQWVSSSHQVSKILEL